MKRIIFSLFTLCAGVSMIFTSCSGDEPVVTEQKTAVNFELSLPVDYSTRALGDEGTIAINQLDYTVYDAEDNAIVSGTQSVDLTGTNLSVNVTLDLVPQQTYSIVFFASNTDSKFAKYTDGIVNVEYTEAASNAETDDAFSGRTSFTLDDTTSKIIMTLHHTFAQINFGTSDAGEGVVTTGYNSSMSVASGLSKQINLLTGIVSSPVENVVLKASFITVDNPGYPENADLKLVQMNYVLPQDSSIPSLIFTSYDGETELNSFTLTDVPVALNYRTNISGNLFTKGTSDVKKAFIAE